MLTVVLKLQEGSSPETYLWVTITCLHGDLQECFCLWKILSDGVKRTQHCFCFFEKEWKWIHKVCCILTDQFLGLDMSTHWAFYRTEPLWTSACINMYLYKCEISSVQTCQTEKQQGKVGERTYFSAGTCGGVPARPAPWPAWGSLLHRSQSCGQCKDCPAAAWRSLLSASPRVLTGCYRHSSRFSLQLVSLSWHTGHKNVF